jgi:hypothetical protein
VLASDLATDADLRTRFEREARAIAALDNPLWLLRPSA